MYDVIIIGAGVIGSAIARELSRYDAKLCVLEKNHDVCESTSKANSGIVHAGFDAEIGSMKAKMNEHGNRVMDRIAAELDVPFQRVGAMVCCFDKSEIEALEALKARGEKNGIPKLEIINGDKAREMEPNLSADVVAALYAPTSGIICPFELTMGFAENAAMNGAEFKLDTEVLSIDKTDKGYMVKSNNGELEARTVINAAGVYADKWHNMVCDKKIKITPRRGEYNLLDRATQGLVNHTIFTLPTKLGKGVLVTPTVYGNPLVGPTSTDIEDKEATRTTSGGLGEIREKSAKAVENVPLGATITSFAGLRAHPENDDFIIGESAENFFDTAGIESPGLTSAPAIGEFMAELVSSKLDLKLKESFNPKRKRVTHLIDLTPEQRKEIIAKDPAYGAIVCRCEEVSEGEILEAIHRPLGAKSLDGIKRRTRGGAGRCQAGFCSPRVMEILARELKLDMTEICKNDAGSQIVYEKTRKGEA